MQSAAVPGLVEAADGGRPAKAAVVRDAHQAVGGHVRIRVVVVVLVFVLSLPATRA